MNKNETIRKLESGLNEECADYLDEAMANLSDGTCDWIELIPILEKIADKDLFYHFDDNSSGGFPRPSGEPSSYKEWAQKAIENILQNRKFEATGYLADQLKSNDINSLKIAINQISKGNCIDEKLIPILEKIAKKDRYSSYSYYGGWKPNRTLGENAKKAINRINENIEASKLNRE